MRKGIWGGEGVGGAGRVREGKVGEVGGERRVEWRGRRDGKTAVACG
jgi:hypothetical protein